MSCDGGSDGTATVTPTGGTLPYTYLWSDGQTSLTAIGLIAGSYSCVITDALGCSFTSPTVTVTQPLALTATSSFTDVSCDGGSDGTATVTPTGGTLPYTYLWSDGQTSLTAIGLIAGSYSCVITDALGCSFTSPTVTVSQPLALTATSSFTDVSCDGGSDGTATVTPTGGTLPYTYLWSDGQTSLTAIGLIAGSYSCVITDALGCSFTSPTVTVTQPLALTATSSFTDVSCDGGSDGTATVTPTGGTLPYTYLWSDGQTSLTAIGLIAGSYSCVITDALGCSFTSPTVTVSQPLALTATSSFTDVSCDGGSDGTATVTPTGGTLPYTYLWSDGQTSLTAIGLIAGSYSCVITDALGCSFTSPTVTVSQPLALTATSSFTDVSCDGGSDGTATVTPTGGTLPYTYLWSDGQTSLTAIGLIAGSYSCVITDALGCSFTSPSIIISQPPAVTSSFSDTTSCDYFDWNGNIITSSGVYFQVFTSVLGCDSIHYLNATIHTSDIVIDNVGSHCDSYTWIDGITYTSSNNTATYILTNTSGCDSTIILDLVIYQKINLSATITDESCSNSSDGSIVLSVSGGLGTFLYSWNGTNFNSFASDIFSLEPGTYNLTVTDNSTQCFIDTFFVLATGFEMQINYNINNISCFDTSDGAINITPVNLISPVYNWSDISSSLEDRSNLDAGVYYLEIFDNNCILKDTFVVTQPDSLFLIATQTFSVCDGSSLGEISVDVYGGTHNVSGLAYSYYWNNFVNTPVNSNLTSGIYTLSVIDANACELKDTFEITSYTLDITLVVEDPSCHGFSNGSIDLEVISGYPNFSYNWSNGFVIQDLYNLAAGSYTCQITDAVGCNIDTTIIISEPSILTATPLISHIACYGENTGTVSLSISGGTPEYNLDWGNIDTNNLFAAPIFMR